jgi:asparagine synthase (glutamine-hydrolysing)
MCGFIGRINSARRAPLTDPPPLDGGLDFLRRRGPDSVHHWRSGDGRVELIQARLAIVDPDRRADLPFSEPRHGLTAIFNGEVYNYAELRRELADHPFRTDSDTEVLLAAFARWGVDGLKRLRGMFACVVVDERQRRVYLFRDPVGKKPLFVAHWPGGVLFGSSLLPLAAAVRQPPRVRPEVLQPFWDRGYIPPAEAALAGARPLAPGEVLELDWHGDVGRQTDCFPEAHWTPPQTFAEAREQVGRLLDEAVRKRLHNNPNPVSLLSGGIDSTVITVRMRQLAAGSALTLGALLPLGQDEKYARYAAWRCGAPLEVLRARPGRLEEDVAWALDLQDEPLGMAAFFLLALLLRAARNYGKILLAGDGGDEVFGGYGRPGDWTDPAKGVGEYAAGDCGVVVGAPAPAWMNPWGRFTVGHSLLGHMFAKLDRASAEQGVEVRCPLLDWDLLTYARTIRPELLFHGGRMKALLKAQLPGWPRWFLERPKLGFAYHLRWAWGLRRYAGLREMVAPEAVDAFGEMVPACLRRPPGQWRSWDVLRNFNAAWKLLVWSRFLRRFSQATRPGLTPERRTGPLAPLGSL